MLRSQNSERRVKFLPFSFNLLSFLYNGTKVFNVYHQGVVLTQSIELMVDLSLLEN